MDRKRLAGKSQNPHPYKPRVRHPAGNGSVSRWPYRWVVRESSVADRCFLAVWRGASDWRRRLIIRAPSRVATMVSARSAGLTDGAISPFLMPSLTIADRRFVQVAKALRARAR